MPDSSEQQAVTVKVVQSIAEIPATEWDDCAGPDHPFVRHSFLEALEHSGSVGTEAGWVPHHLVVEDEAGRAIGAAPAYLKGHSYGEYVFDHGWADAYERAGGSYYPKLQCAVPFTPVTGPRLLVRPDPPAPFTVERIADALTQGLMQVTERYGISSLHVTFPTRPEWERFGGHGMLQRIGRQYHWQNEGYGSFDDFLAALASRKRKAIRKERRAVAESDLQIRTLSGAQIEPHHWDAFYAFYKDTGGRKWGVPYLTKGFFHRIGETMPERIALVMAERDGKPIAGALNLIGTDCLYGRNWGCIEDHPFLHFEACYYRAIDFAIERGLARVEAGAQGEHKIQRGYVPTETYSAHHIPDPHFRRAVEDFLTRERMMVAHEIAGLSEYAPFRHSDGEPVASPPQTDKGGCRD